MKKIIIITIINLLSIFAFSQKIEVKKDTLIVTEYEKINFIKISGKVYKIKIELVEVKDIYLDTLFGKSIRTFPYSAEPYTPFDIYKK